MDTDLLSLLRSRFQATLAAAFGPEYAHSDPLLRWSDGKFGDVQCNAAMALAKPLGMKNRDVAGIIVPHLALDDLCEPLTEKSIAGPGFINVRLKNATLDRQLHTLVSDSRLNVPLAHPAQKVVVDYCGANIAKQMHVGHLRSTVIGDCLARVLAFLRHEVIRQNHVGDWGLQMGMVAHAVDKAGLSSSELTLEEIEQLYREINAKQEADPALRAELIEETRKLQQTPKSQLVGWQRARELTLAAVHDVFRTLDVTMTPADERGESFYSEQYAPMIAELRQRGLAVETAGAIGIFPPGFKNQDGDPRPFLIQSRDGTYQYATFDLAAICYRVQHLHAERIIYTHDSRQAEHFAMLFAVARLVGYAIPGAPVGPVSSASETQNSQLTTQNSPTPNPQPPTPAVQLDFAPFGTVLGENNRPLKTRTGENVKLADLIAEAEKRALDVVQEKNPDLPPAKQLAVAHAVAIGALKYADLSTERVKDYVFSWDRMLALKGNTAPYLQYAYTRIQSIFRKANADGKLLEKATLHVGEPTERALAIELLQFPDVVEAVADRLEPHRLCNYLYDLATLFSGFYEACPVLSADAAVRDSRLALCDLTGRTLKLGLDLLGIAVMEAM